MDLETECSPLEYVEENELVTQELSANRSEIKTENNIGTSTINGSHSEHVDADRKADTSKIAELANSPSQSPSGSTDSSPTIAPVKGYGLKKWKRIPREVNHDGESNIDSNKILKRVLPNSQPNMRKSEGSVSSRNALLKSPVGFTGDFSIQGENGLAMGPIFAAGTDSENSEDHSSKSSTAASAPRMRYEVASTVGFACDKGKVRNPGEKILGNSIQKVQQKGRIDETSKKARGDGVKLEKENSHSSLESDSRSSNFVFMQGLNSVSSNGRQQHGRSVNYDGDNSDEAQGSTGFRKSVASFEDVSQENFVRGSTSGIKEEKSENGGSSADRDPLLDYILDLQSVQEQLEKVHCYSIGDWSQMATRAKNVKYSEEVEKLREIGKEDTPPYDDSAKSGTLPSDITCIDPKNDDSIASDSGENKSLETQMIILKNNLDILETKLDETRATLKTKEAKVVELEAALLRINSKDPSGEPTGVELEEFFMQKIKTEVEYLVISSATKENGERKTGMVQNSGGVILGEDEILKMKRRVSKYSRCFLIQFILVVLMCGLVALRLAPHSDEVVPT